MDHVLCFLVYALVGLARFSRFLARLGLGTYEEWKEGEKWKILLVGYNGARNTGSDVRVVAIARQLRELFGEDQVSITVLTMDEKSLEGYFDPGVTLYPFSTVFLLDLYRACCSHHAAILCEGSTLKSTFANALTLFLCEAAGIMSRQGKPCLAYGSEIGQMEPFLERAAKRLCWDTTFIPRTRGSLEALQRLGLSGHAGTDAAWCYDQAISCEEAGQLLMQQGWDGIKPLLGIAVIDPFCWPARASLTRWARGGFGSHLKDQYDKWYFFSTSKRRQAAYETYIREVAKGTSRFLQEQDGYPVVIGMERLDEKACRDLRALLGKEGACFLSGTTPAQVMTGVLRSLSALVTSRYHAAVLSMEHGCPLVGISMDERLDGILRELSLERFLLHVDEEDLGEKLYERLSQACLEAGPIRERIRKQVAVYHRTLEEMGAFMKTYIQQGCAKKTTC